MTRRWTEPDTLTGLDEPVVIDAETLFVGLAVVVAAGMALLVTGALIGIALHVFGLR